MVRRVFGAIAGKISGLHEAAFWLASFSILSQVLAFVRDRLLAFHFGAGESLDIYYTAFRIPDFIFVTVGSLVSISVLVPMMFRKARDEEGAVKSYISSIFTAFSVLVALSCVAAFIVMPYVAPFLFRGFDAEALSEIIKLSRILLLSPMLLGLSNFFGSIVQYEKRFLLYSISPVLYNVGIISGTALGASDFGVYAVVVGVVFGAVMHFAIQAGFVIFSGKAPRFTARINWAEAKETALVSVPRALALSATQIITIVFTAVASFFGAGAVAVLSFSFNLQSVPLSIIGTSYSLAAFPTISEHYAKNNIAECGRFIGESLRYIVFWTLPASALFIILRSHIVRVVLGSGAFDWTDTKLTAAAMSVFALSFAFQSAQLFLTRAHYALGRTKTPLFWGMTGASATILLSVALYFGFLSESVGWLQKFLEIGGLAGSKIIILPVSFSLGSLLTAAGLWISLDKETKSIAKAGFSKTFADSLLASLIIGLVSFYSLRIFDQFWQLDSLLNVSAHAFVSGIAGIAAGVGTLLFLKNKEIKEILGKFRHNPLNPPYLKGEKNE